MGITTLPEFSHSEQLSARNGITGALFANVMGIIIKKQRYQNVRLTSVVDNSVKIYGIADEKSQQFTEWCNSPKKSPQGGSLWMTCQ